MSQIDRSKQPPFGRGENIDWSGGMARIVVKGQFLSATSDGHGVATCVDLHYQARQPDGSLARGEVVKTVREPGTYRIALSPGVCWFQASGPDESVRSIEASMMEFGA